MQVFGSGGFRSEFGKNFMTLRFIEVFTRSLAEFILEKGYGLPVIIARDTRNSGEIIEKWIVSILNYLGIDTHLIGIIPTPGLSTIMMSGNYSLGVMITASHNPANDNGIKLFNEDGFNLDRENEVIIEQKIDSYLNSENYIYGEHIGLNLSIEKPFKEYIDTLRKEFISLIISDNILVDCSNGACSETVTLALKKQKKIKVINNEPNGIDINLNCGAMEPDLLMKLIRHKDYDYGVAFDGDGDRAIFANKDYGLIETDKLTVLLTEMMYGRDSNPVIISTEICNKGLKENLKALGVELIETEVGDRNVIEKAKERKAILGMEPSGHYFFPKASRSMDGILALYYFFELLQKQNGILLDRLDQLKHYNRITKNIMINNTFDVDIRDLKNEIKSFINHEKEKLIVRQSMWEPVIRIYYDYEKENNFNEIEPLILNILK